MERNVPAELERFTVARERIFNSLNGDADNDGARDEVISTVVWWLFFRRSCPLRTITIANFQVAFVDIERYQDLTITSHFPSKNLDNLSTRK
jgi:hypothetical protein